MLMVLTEMYGFTEYNNENFCEKENEMMNTKVKVFTFYSLAQRQRSRQNSKLFQRKLYALAVQWRTRHR